MPEWTKAQRKAIEARGTAIVVSAAAGSGKTTVLIERIIEMIISGECSVDEILVVTFTRAATAEIRTRLSSAITKAIREHPENDNLVRQQMLVPSANIFTIDAFCSALVREHFTALGDGKRSPEFKTLDEGMKKTYIADAVSKTLDSYYAEGSENFRILEHILSRSFSYSLEKAILDIYDKAHAHRDPEQALADSIRFYTFDGPAEESPVVKAAVENFTAYAEYLLGGLERGIRFIEGNSEITENKYGSDTLSLLCEDRDRLSKCLELIGQFRLEEAFHYGYSTVGPWTRGSFPCKKDYEMVLAKAYRDKANALFKNDCENLKKYFGTGLTYLEEDGKLLRPALLTLLQMVSRFGEEYEKIKAEKDAFDFSDIEHRAYRLLIDRDGNRTALAEDIAKSFKQILIDEYQDTNELQDALFTAISDNEKNLFVVGDVKQSIYAFRNAMPELFLHKKNTYEGALFLGENFRSSYAIVDYVNFVFSQIMSEQCGDIDYSREEEQLKYGKKEEIDPKRRDVELYLLSGNKTHNLESEGPFIADYIKKEMKADPSLKYSDFAVLMRKVGSGRGQKIADALTKAGIPVIFEGGTDFFDSSDIRTVISLLHVIDNPLQDVHMLAVLLSPVFGLSPDTVTEIRLENGKKGSVYANLLALEDNNPHIKSICEVLRLYRRLSLSMPVGELLRKIYDDTLLPDIVAGKPGGISRQANLLLLQHYAESFEQNNEIGIAGFVRYLDSLIENEIDLESASLASSSANAVKVMTIHKSKGLQFQYCLLPDLGTSRRNTETSIVFGRDFQLGLKSCDPETGDIFPSFVFNYLRNDLKARDMSEELRILYVAMTRAKQRLVLIGTVSNGDKEAALLLSDLNGRALCPEAVINAPNFISLILAATMHHTNSPYAGEYKCPLIPTETRIITETLDALELEQEETETSAVFSDEVDEQMKAELKARMNYEYPYRALATVPTKRSASATEAAGFNEKFFATAVPEFLKKDRLTAAQKGTVLHRFMQFADFDKAKADPDSEVKRLTEKGYFTEREAASIDTDKIRAFFKSDIFRRMEESTDLMREKKFAVLVPASRFNADLPKPLGEEKVLIQGIADCVFVEDNALVIVDYKTDRTRDEEELIARHSGQLATYAEALSGVLALPVKAAYLYSFSLGRDIRVL